LFAVDHQAHALDIRLELPLRRVLRSAHVVPYSRTFATNLTFCHSSSTSS
jgi:hypothetical protein